MPNGEKKIMPPGKCYATALALVIAASAYPIYMGVVTLASYFANGYVGVADYPKYIIPYTPLCVGVIVAVALMPLLVRLLQKAAMPAALLLGTGLFLGIETWLEQIQVLDTYASLPIDSWQYSLCRAPAQTLQMLGEPIYADGNPVYKIHFYLIAIVILVVVVGMAFGFYRMALEGKTERKKPLTAQLIAVCVFVGLCVLACFTAFWRNGMLRISMLSAICMTIFSIVFGITVGTFAGSLLYGKKKLLSCLIPAVLAAVTTLMMYVGELTLMDGQLYQFGAGWFFLPVGSIPFAPVDMVVIAAAGVLAYLLMRRLNARKEKSAHETQSPEEG